MSVHDDNEIVEGALGEVKRRPAAASAGADSERGRGRPERQLGGTAPRNCCDTKVFLWSFWALLGALVVTSFAVGFATGKPWLGALGILSIFPAAGILYFLYWKRDRDRVPEPRVVNLFCWGVVGAIPCAVLELIITFAFARATGFNTRAMDRGDGGEPTSSVVIYALFVSFLVAALCEESLKYFLVTVYPNGIQGVRCAYGVVVLSAAGALGFATLENVGYVFQSTSTRSLAIAVMRALLAVPLHGATGIIIGLNVAAPLLSRDTAACYGVLALPVLIHGCYDSLLMLTLGLEGSTGPAVHALGAVAFCIPVGSLIYASRRVKALPQEWFVDQFEGLVGAPRGEPHRAHEEI